MGRARTGTAILSSDITLSSEGKAPTEIRLLKNGLNDSDYGPFMFDEVAATLVMASYDMKGIPRLYADWNHEMLPKYSGERISREQGKASCGFTPAVRNGELWAIDIEWTEDGLSDVEDGSYNLFSPAFEFECMDDGQCRPRKLINFALVNMAGLNGINPLIAAMAKTQETTMEFEKLYTETKAQLDAANARIKTLEGNGGEVVALSAAVGLAGDAASADRLRTVQGLVALRGEVYKITGKDSPESAIGTLQALKIKADRTDVLESERANEQVVALRADLDAVWKKADDEKKITPGQRPVFEASLLAGSGGKLTKEVVAAAKDLVAQLSPVVAPAGAGAKQPSTNTIVLSSGGLNFAKAMGVKPEDVNLFLNDRPAWEEKIRQQAAAGGGK